LGWRRGGHLCRVADNTVWSHWQVASRSSGVNFTKNYTLLTLFSRLLVLVLVRQRPGLPGRRLSKLVADARVCRHSNTRCQLDAQQLWRQHLCRRRTTSLKQFAAQSQTMWAVRRPVQAVTEDIFMATVQCELFYLRRIEIFSLTYLLGGRTD